MSPTPEQMKEFEEYLKTHSNEPVSEQVLREIIDDDVKEADEISAKRDAHSRNREYNAKTIDPIERRETEEEGA